MHQIPSLLHRHPSLLQPSDSVWNQKMKHDMQGLLQRLEKIQFVMRLQTRLDSFTEFSPSQTSNAQRDIVVRAWLWESIIAEPYAHCVTLGVVRLIFFLLSQWCQTQYPHGPLPKSKKCRGPPREFSKLLNSIACKTDVIFTSFVRFSVGINQFFSK